MERRSFMKLMGAVAAVPAVNLITTNANAADAVTIALIPGLTADGFYVTMHKGAEAAAKAAQEVAAKKTAEGEVSKSAAKKKAKREAEALAAKKK